MRTIAVEESANSAPKKTREAQRRSEAKRRAGDDCHRRDDLDAAAANHPLTHAHDARQGQLEADREQQEDDADFGERRDGVGLVDEPERVRPDRDAGEQESDDRRHAQPLRDDDDRDGDRDEDDEVAENGDFVHAVSCPRRGGEGSRGPGTGNGELRKIGIEASR